MAQLLYLDTFSSDSGDLTVVEKIMPGRIRRAFYIQEGKDRYGAGRRYRRAWVVLICLTGSCRMYTHDGTRENRFLLDSPQQCLLLEPSDGYRIEELTPGALLLVLANDDEEPADWIPEPD